MLLPAKVHLTVFGDIFCHSWKLKGAADIYTQGLRGGDTAQNTEQSLKYIRLCL
jgi:hypothetical protein